MTELVSSFHSDSTTTINTPTAAVGELNRDHFADPRQQQHQHNAAVSHNPTTSLSQQVMGSPPLPLHEEAAAAPQQHRVEAMANNDFDSTVAAGAAAAEPSLFLSNSRQKSGHDISVQRERHQTSPGGSALTPHSEREGCQNSSLNTRDNTTPQRSGTGASLLPQLSNIVGTSKETSMIDVQGSPHHLLALHVNSPSPASAGKPLMSPDYCTRNQQQHLQQQSSMSSARDASVDAAGLRNRNSCSTASSNTPPSASASHARDEAHRGSGDAQPLPLLTRSGVLLSPNSQGRRLTGALLDTKLNSSTAAAILSRSSSVSSMCGDNDVPMGVPHSSAVEGAPAVPQLAPAPPLLPSNCAAVENVFPGFAPCPFSTGTEDFDDNPHRPANRFADDGTSTAIATSQQASPLCPTTSEVTFSLVPVITTDVCFHGELPSDTTMPTGFGNSHTSAPAHDGRTGVSAANSAAISGVATPSGGSCSVVHESAGRNSGSAVRNDIGDNENTAAATAAQWATGARRPSDSIAEAIDPKAAKRRLKKGNRAKKAKKEKLRLPHEVGADASAAADVDRHRSDSEMQRRRQRKKLEKQEKLKQMSTEEKRFYKADHQRRRAAKKAQRSSSGASPAPETSETCINGPQPQQRQPVNDARPLMSSSSPAPLDPHAVSAATSPPTDSVAGAHHNGAALNSLETAPLPISFSLASPNLEMGNHNSSSNDGGNDEDERLSAAILDMTQSTPQLANTACPSDNNRTGGATLLHALKQVRRCTSAKGPTVSLAVLSATPPHGSSCASYNFRRRLMSETTPTGTPQYRANSFLYLPANDGSATGTKQQGQQTPHGDEVQVDSSRGGAEDFADEDAEVVEDSLAEEIRTLTNQALNGSAMTEASMKESVVTSGRTVPFIAPHPPVSAAGSGATAILELKHQQQQKLQQQLQEKELESAATQHPLIPSAHDLVGNTDAHHKPHSHVKDCLAGATALAAATASEATRNASVEQHAMDVSATLSSSFRADSLVPPSDVVKSSSAVFAAVSPSVNRDRNGDDDELESKPQWRRAAAGSGSVSSVSYYSSYSHSQEGSAHHHNRHQEHRDHKRHRDSAAAAVEMGSHKEGSPQALRESRRRSSAVASCLSFHSRDGDDDSDAGGSSSYSYSYTSSTSSSCSSAGGVVAEVLPLKEGCTTAPPSASFQDLKYRYACVAQLQAYAEPAVIHEWNLTEGCWGRVETSVVLNPQPFSKGNMRASYYMIDMRRLNCMLVAKRYLKSSVGEDQYFDDVSMHSISGHWARAFNAMHPPKKVRFVPAAVLILPKRNPPLILAMEPLLTGKFVKYNNNCGYVRRNARWTPQAFSHFTYEASNHTLMVVDIQGVDDYYTDPQILSPDGKGYGRGNLGKKGIRRFLESHKCNDVCRAVGLLPLRRNSKGVVIAPLALAKGGNGSSLPATPGAAERLALASPSSGLKDERLPPKIYTASPQGLSSTPHSRERSPLLSSGGAGGQAIGTNNSSGHTCVNSLADSSRPGSEAGYFSSSLPGRHNNTSGHSSPNPAAALTGGIPGSIYNSHNNNGGGGNGKVGASPPVYSVKYVPYPRHARVRSQSQYFTSTVAGGLMAVPPSANVPCGLGTPTAQMLHMTGGMPSPSQGPPPSQQQPSQQQQQHSPATLAGQPGGGTGSAAVPLLRPPTMARAGGAGGSGGGYPVNPPKLTGSDGFVGAAGKKSSSQLGLINSPRLEPANGAVAGLHPHPSKSRFSSMGGLSMGTLLMPTLSGSGGAQNVSQTSSSIAMMPGVQAAQAVQTVQETPIVGGAPHPRRQSFNRRPVFSSFEESSITKPKHQRHRK